MQMQNHIHDHNQRRQNQRDESEGCEARDKADDPPDRATPPRAIEVRVKQIEVIGKYHTTRRHQPVCFLCHQVGHKKAECPWIKPVPAMSAPKEAHCNINRMVRRDVSWSGVVRCGMEKTGVTAAPM